MTAKAGDRSRPLSAAVVGWSQVSPGVTGPGPWAGDRAGVEVRAVPGPGWREPEGTGKVAFA